MGGNSLKKENILSSLRKQNDTFWFVILLLCKAEKKALSLKWTLGRLSSQALVVEKTPQRPLSARGCIKLGPEKRTPSKDYLKIRKKGTEAPKTENMVWSGGKMEYEWDPPTLFGEYAPNSIWQAPFIARPKTWHECAAVPSRIIRKI